MKYLVLVVLVVSLNQIGFGQQQKMRQKIEAARIALISERLSLSPAEAEMFWPVYNEYRNQRKTLNKKFKSDRMGVDQENLTEEERKQFLKQSMELKQKELDLEKEYSHKLLNIISTEQLMALETAEKDFRRMLLERVRRSKGQHAQPRSNRPRKNN